MSNDFMKPNLVNPNLKKKIADVLAPPQDDYWAPAKDGAKSFYQYYIRNNMFTIIIIIVIILILIYRFRITREKKRDNVPVLEREKVDPNIVNIAVQEYNRQKENLREPQINVKKPSSKNFPIYAYGQMP